MHQFQIASETLTTATAPWWSVALLAGILAVASAVSGAVISYLSTAKSDQRRENQARALRDHEDLQKEREELRRAGARFLVASRQFVKDYQKNFSGDRTEPNRGTIYTLKADPKENDIRSTYEAYWELVFLCNDECSNAARSLLRCTRRFQLTLDSQGVVRPLNADQFKQAYDSLIAARQELVRAIMRVVVKPARG